MEELDVENIDSGREEIHQYMPKTPPRCRQICLSAPPALGMHRVRTSRVRHAGPYDHKPKRVRRKLFYSECDKDTASNSYIRPAALFASTRVALLSNADGKSDDLQQSTSSTDHTASHVDHTTSSTDHTTSHVDRPTSSVEVTDLRTPESRENYLNSLYDSQRRQFTDKYNFDPVNGQVLPGKFKWCRVESSSNLLNATATSKLVDELPVHSSPPTPPKTPPPSSESDAASCFQHSSLSAFQRLTNSNCESNSNQLAADNSILAENDRSGDVFHDERVALESTTSSLPSDEASLPMSSSQPLLCKPPCVLETPPRSKSTPPTLHEADTPPATPADTVEC